MVVHSPPSTSDPCRSSTADVRAENTSPLVVDISRCVLSLSAGIIVESGCKEISDLRRKARLSHGADHRLEGSVSVDEHERRLAPNVVLHPDLQILIGDVGEGADRKIVDKGCHGTRLVSACDADDGDLSFELFLHLCDRTGFTTARASPRCPEPQDDVLTGKRVGVDLATADEIARPTVSPLGGHVVTR